MLAWEFTKRGAVSSLLMQNLFFRNLYACEDDCYVQIFSCKCQNQLIQNQLNQNQLYHNFVEKHFVFLSNGNCNFEIWDDKKQTEIDILAFGVWNEETLGLTRRILSSHRIRCVIFPENPQGEEIRQKLMHLGIARVLTGEGKEMLGPWMLRFWSRQGYLSVFHDYWLSNASEELVMGELNISNDTACASLSGREQEYCETSCLQFMDSDALNGRLPADGEICTGTLILGREYPECWDSCRDKIRAVLLTSEKKEYPLLIRALSEAKDRLYHYIFGGNLSNSQAGQLILSSPYIRYQSLKRHNSVCINGCYVSGLGDAPRDFPLSE